MPYRVEVVLVRGPVGGCTVEGGRYVEPGQIQASRSRISVVRATGCAVACKRVDSGMGGMGRRMRKRWSVGSSCGRTSGHLRGDGDANHNGRGNGDRDGRR